MLRRTILAAARSGTARRLITNAPVSRAVVRRFVAGDTVDDAVRVSRQLVDAGLSVSLDHLGEDTTEEPQAKRAAAAYLTALERLAAAGLTKHTEVSVKLSAVGLLLDPAMAREHARTICEAAVKAGTTATIDMEDHTTTDATLDVVRQLRTEFPSLGVVLQAYLRRTEADCRELAYEGSRVRLCKGAYREPESVAFQDKHEVDRSYVRCLNALMGGPGYPMIATHDPRLIAIADDRARWYDRARGTYEYQMLYGIRPDEQIRLAADGETVRIYVPFGDESYGYLMRRMAERPANVAFFLRSLASKK
ncbi:MAG: proline dehydrogenase family protein [Actinomycetota bacterium]|nr:proline dehydrogenase family protein [Actinomycetota bacterium]